MYNKVDFNFIIRIYIDESSDMKLSMPLFSLEDLIIQMLVGQFSNKYYRYRYERGDNTLFMYLYHGLIAKIYNYQKRIYNTFGYYKLKVQIEKGTLDNDIKNQNYYLMSKKVYSNRFSTDCFSDFFNAKALRSKIGLNDLPEFKTTKATFNELEGYKITDSKDKSTIKKIMKKEVSSYQRRVLRRLTSLLVVYIKKPKKSSFINKNYIFLVANKK